MKLSLYYPCKPYQVFQGFGDNDACYNPTTGTTITRMAETCPTGFIGLYEYSGMKGHNGLDLYAPTEWKIHYAGPDGKVDEVVDEPARGLGLGITTDEGYELEGGVSKVKTRYWHMKSFVVKKGDAVKTGDLIGYADTTGYASGSHLHFELKPVRIGAGGIYANIFQDNGFYGAVDPAPYFTGKYAEDIHSAFRYTFNYDLEYGQISPEVAKLQKALQLVGYFPESQMVTNFYGPITRNAVFAFQRDYVANQSIRAYLTVWANWGKYCSSLTRGALNKMFS